MDSWGAFGRPPPERGAFCHRELLKELSMESGIDPGQDYYTQDYYNYDHGYDLPQYGSRRKLISPSGLYDEYGEVVVDDDGSYYYSPQESDGEVRRQFQGGRLAPHPAYLQPRPPPSHGPSKKTPGAPAARTEGDKKQPPDGGPTMSTKPKSSSAAARLKAVMRVSSLLSSGSKTSGQPPAIHPPWNKARVRPVEEGEGSRDRVDRVQERKGEGRGLERGEMGKRENKVGGRDEAAERGRERAEMETWGRSNRGGVMNNGMRNALERGEGVRPEHRGELPGLLSAGHYASLDGGIVIDGSYFQTSVEASKPPPVKQKLSEALSLISLARRLQGPTRVGDEQWSDGTSWDRGEGNSRKMYGSVGDMSVSASVSEQARGEERRRRLEEENNSSSEHWWKREKRFHDSDSETGSGSKESPSEFSQSDASSLTSSVTAEQDKTESDTETEKNESDSGTEKEEGTPDTESERGSESERESGLESEDEGKESSRKRSKSVSKCSARRSSISSKSSSSSSSSSSRRSANVRRQRSKATDRNSSRDSKSSRYSGSRPKTSRHSRSSHETIEEEGGEDSEAEEESEEEEVKSTSSRKSSSRRRSTNRIQSDSDDLSPIIEDTEEEEERSSSHGGRKGDEDEEEEEEEEDLENESAD